MGFRLFTFIKHHLTLISLLLYHNIVQPVLVAFEFEEK